MPEEPNVPPRGRHFHRSMAVLLLAGAFVPLLSAFVGVLALDWSEELAIRVFLFALPACVVCFFVLLSQYLSLRQRFAPSSGEAEGINRALFFGGPLGLVVAIFRMTRRSARGSRR